MQIRITIQRIFTKFLMLGYICQSSSKSTFTLSQIDLKEDNLLIWDKLLPDNHHLKSDKIKFYNENTSVESLTFIVWDQKEPIAAIYLQKSKFPLNQIKVSDLKISLLELFTKCVENLSCSLDVLVCGNIFKSNQEGFYIKKGYTRIHIFETLVEFLEQNPNTKNFAGLLVKECDTPFDISKKLIPFSQDISMQMCIDPSWKNMGDYASVLDKKYRSRYKKIIAKFDSLTFTELNIEDIKLHQKRIYELYLEVLQNQTVKLGEIKPTYFLELKKLLGDNLQVFGVFKDEKIIAFSTHIFSGNGQMEIHYIGIDYTENENYNLYFNILYFGLSEAINRHQSKIELGRTAEVAKSSMGAKPVKKLNYLYFKKHIYKLSFKLWIEKLMGGNNAEQEFRNPFNSTTKQSV